MRKDVLVTPIPDIRAYLDRIGVGEIEKPDLENLDLLIRQHQYNVTFENLDVYLGKKTVSLLIDDLFDKIVVRKRGGFCFEQNALFCQLLRGLGYHVDAVFCRGFRDPEYVSPCLHRASVVHLEDGLYFCDVGFGGPMPGGAVKIEDGYERTILGEHFGIAKDDEYWWTIWRTNSKGERQNALQFNLFPQTNSEFLAPNAYCCSDSSNFRKRFFLNLRTPGGHYSLGDKVFRIEDNGTATEEVIEDRDRLEEVLDKYFGLGGVMAEFEPR